MEPSLLRTASLEPRAGAGGGDRFLADLLHAVQAAEKGEELRVDVPPAGLARDVAQAVNGLIEHGARMRAEVGRLAEAVGRNGRIAERIDVDRVDPPWRATAAAVNALVDDLVRPTNEIARVISAVADGDLSQKMAVTIAGRPVKGEFRTIGTVVNSMVDQLHALADEVSRVAREVGTDGMLGGKATVAGISGSWKDLTDTVNSMTANLTEQVRNIALVTTAVARGDLTQKITVHAAGEVAELKETVNTMVGQLSGFAGEVTRVAREVGTEGKLGGQAQVPGVSGTWKDLTESVNFMAGNLTAQVRNIAQVATAVVQGDLRQKITVEARGEVAELKKTVNTMVGQLSAFADEVTRVAREVGTEGKLGGQAEVKGVSGTWRDLTTSVNSMADNLTDQVRNIAQVTTAVALGDLGQKITVDARGEILQLKNTINTMVDQLSAFASEVTRVAREVGTEGRLGGQAEVEGVSGTWRHLTESVNQLASNLTTQVRSIAEVATAVTKGDLTRTITVEAPGEVGLLKDNINQMIGNLVETTTRNQEQAWLKSNLARIGAMLQGHRDLRAVSELLMSELTPLVGAQQGAFFMADRDRRQGPTYRLLAGYALSTPPDEDGRTVRLGEGLVGQAAKERRLILVPDVPEDYSPIFSGLGSAAPRNIAVLPVPFEDEVLAVIELATFRPLSETNRMFLEQIVGTVGVVLSTILATMRTESLLAQSQTLAQELQSRQQELQLTNAELEDKARELARQNQAIEVQNAEIELARQELEERAEQLALSSRYKSEFLANMSHELRTPLNSLLILANILAENADGTLSDEQVEFATNIRDAGNDLRTLISDILDLTKIEAGKMEVAVAPVAVSVLCEDLAQTFRPIAAQKSLRFAVEVEPALAPVSITTDEQRLRQVLKNLLSNACKFTDEGSVMLRVGVQRPDVEPRSRRLRGRTDLVEFAVSDSGIGIAPDKLAEIFEPFQQADGTTSRRYGGTGLGLSISRELVELLGGEIRVESKLGEGSTFTLVVPRDQVPRAEPEPQARRVAEGEHASLPLVRSVDADRVSVAERSGPLVGCRALVVDDDLRNLYALTSALERQGVEVVTATTGAEGARLLSAGAGVDVVLMDIMMPGMDGYETIRAIRAVDAHRDLPIIALTAKAMVGDREKALAAGASDYISKPIDMEELLDMMRLWLYR